MKPWWKNWMLLIAIVGPLFLTISFLITFRVVSRNRIERQRARVKQNAEELKKIQEGIDRVAKKLKKLDKRRKGDD